MERNRHTKECKSVRVKKLKKGMGVFYQSKTLSEVMFMMPGQEGKQGYDPLLTTVGIFFL